MTTTTAKPAPDAFDAFLPTASGGLVNNHYLDHHHHQAVIRSSHDPVKSPAVNNTAFPYHFSSPDVHAASSLYRSVSVDAPSSCSSAHHSHTHTTGHLVQRLAQQNALIREAWEAERNYLEANRRRAEEVYHEERVIMEEVREAWENEKAALLRENQLLKERIQRLEGENETLRSIATQHGAGAALPALISPPIYYQRRADGSIETSASISDPDTPAIAPKSAVHPLVPVADPASLPPGLDGASRRPHHLPAPSAISPAGPPDHSSVTPLDPRTQPLTGNSRDFLARPTAADQDPSHVIDIQEVDPKLDGIPLKATAVQRFYRFGGSATASPHTSPPTVEEAPRPDPEPRRAMVKRHSSKDSTIQALQAEEAHRLTMHAGHTPNHSLSLFPTMSMADGSGIHTRDDSVAQSQGEQSRASGSPPPEEQDAVEQAPAKNQSGPDVALPQSDGPAPDGPPDADHEHNPPEQPEDAHARGEEGEPRDQDVGPEHEDHPQERLEPTDDVRLKGPLMVKNIPAQDEIFWDQVNKKLEPISLGQDALPAVMRLSDEDDVDQIVALQAQPTEGGPLHEVSSTIEGAEESVEGEKGVEGDVPLKMKTTTNFGAPFGMA